MKRFFVLLFVMLANCVAGEEQTLSVISTTHLTSATQVANLTVQANARPQAPWFVIIGLVLVAVALSSFLTLVSSRRSWNARNLS